MDDIVIGLANRATGYSYVKGALVQRLQKSLAAAGHPVGAIDAVYGNDSAAAMRNWQRAAGHPMTGEVDAAAFRALTGTDPDPFELSLQLTASFEGHGFGLAKGDFDGAILTWGVIGFTFLHGEVQDLISQIDAAEPGAVSAAFGELEQGFRDFLGLGRTDPGAVAWVQGITVPGSPGVLVPDARDAFAALGATAVAQRLQLQRARAKYWDRAERDAAFLGLSGISGRALCFDIAVQCGGVSKSDKKSIQQRMAVHSERPPGSELRAIIANVVADATANTRYKEDVRARKLAIATGHGKVHGALYDLRDWGLSGMAEGARGTLARVPTVSPVPAVAADMHKEKFLSFFSSLGLKYFRQDEFAYLGAGNALPGDAFNRNHLPPEDLWGNMVPTAQIMDLLRQDLNASIRLTNIYRSKSYNDAVNGAPASQHIRFTAVDFFCSDGRGPEHWAAKLHEYRAAGRFRGGIGIYASNQFVHLDTRGSNADFGD